MTWPGNTAPPSGGTDFPSGASPSTVACPLRFPGQYADPETGLHYNYFRHYHPETARYAATDPLGIEPAPNHHTYVANPCTWSDAYGLAGCAEVNPRKLDYLFNKDIKPDPHNNTPRARQNAGQLKSIEFGDTPASRQLVTGHLRDATKNGFF
nr:RHS repeat-associated core domain-containing protein [Streptomyces sp. PSAA01]